MIIDKAIEVLTKWKEKGEWTSDKELAEAEQLGIEALERVRLWQSVTSGSDKHYLPSQTED